MSHCSTPSRPTSVASAALLSFTLTLGLPTQTHADADDAERVQLAAIVRQLDQIEQQAKQAALNPQERSRYHLDYLRLLADLRRIRGGLQDFLTPGRAQPRDITPLSATYRVEGDADVSARQAPQRAEVKP